MATKAQSVAFIQQIAPLIVIEGTKRGYKVFSTVIAQAVIESNSGLSKLSQPPNFNYFGLKAGKAWILAGKPYATFNTKEDYGNGLVTIKDHFRRFSDMADGVKGYYDFIDTKRYANLKTALNYKQYAEYLKADGYATSQTYVSTLCSTVEKFGLIAYDTGAFPSLGTWEIGKTYTTQQDLNVRKKPNGELLPYEDLTEDGKKHAMISPSGNAILNRGTRVTVQDIKSTGSCTWLKIPSGWICGKNSKNIFVS